MTKPARSLRMTVPPHVILDGPFEVPLGDTAWLPLDVGVHGGIEVELATFIDADDLVAIAERKLVRLPVTATSVRVCVELFGLHLTGEVRHVTIRGTHDAGLPQRAIVPVIVVTDTRS